MPGDSVQGLVRVRNLIMPTCSPNLPASEIGLGSISEEMETVHSNETFGAGTPELKSHLREGSDGDSDVFQQQSLILQKQFYPHY